jgi:hypothetical protein
MTNRKALGTMRLALLSALLLWIAGTPNLARASGTLSLSQSYVTFGNVTVGTSKSVSIYIKNTGTTSVSITSESLVANMYSVSGLTLPKTLSAGTSFTLTVKFSPTSAKTSSGYVQIGSNATDGLIKITVTGTGVLSSTSSSLTATPSSVGFGSVPVGTTYSQTLQLKNTGTSSISVSGGSVTGSGFQFTHYTYPFTLAGGQTIAPTVTFTPGSATTVSGTLAFTSNASDKTLSIALSGTGTTSTKTLSFTPTTLNFGNVAVGKTETLAVALKNTGNSSITLSGVSVSGTNISISGGISGATIAAGQTATLDVSFAPKQAETLTGKVVVTSNASDSSVTITLAGVGVSSTHSVTLDWSPSTSSGIKGYYVYRATSTSMTFSKLFSTPITATNYTDIAVIAGDTYKYEVSAVSTTGVESTRSAAVTAVIP